MKKKSFFNGYNAKLALAVVALTGSLLTGCYKDEGLDIIDPDQSVTLPAAQYTITGTIYSAEGTILTNATVASDKGTVTQNSGSFTISGLSHGAVKVTATCTGFEKQETTVNIAELKPGQAAVYPVNFVLGKTATTKDYETTPLTTRAYKIKASKDGFVSTIQYISLPNAKKEVAIDFADPFATEEYATEIVLVKTATGTVVLAGDLKFGTRWILAKGVRLYHDKGTQFYGEGNSNTYAYKFNVPETEFVEETTTRAISSKFFSATFKIVDENGIEMTLVQKIAKPTASTEPGGEEPNVEVKIDFSFNVEVTRTNAAPTLLPTVDTFDPMIVNGTDRVKQYTYDIPVLVGMKTIDIQGGNLGSETALGVAVAQAMKAATDTIVADGYENALIEKGYKFELAPYTAVKSITSKQEFVDFTIGVTKVTSTTIITSGDEEPVETTTDVNMDLSGVYAKYQAAGTATVNYDDMEIIKVSHDHGHDHGHGTGNAGGGIIEAE